MVQTVPVSINGGSEIVQLPADSFQGLSADTQFQILAEQPEGEPLQAQTIQITAAGADGQQQIQQLQIQQQPLEQLQQVMI